MIYHIISQQQFLSCWHQQGSPKTSEALRDNYHTVTPLISPTELISPNSECLALWYPPLCLCVQQLEESAGQGSLPPAFSECTV